MNKFLERIKKMPTMDLTALIASIGFLVFFGTFLLKDSSLFKSFEFLETIGVALSSYLLGCPGLVCIIRRECPILPLGHAIKGWGAVLIGGILFVLGLSIGTLILVSIWM